MALRFGLIGCGGMGRELARVLRDAVADADVVAACDPYAPNLRLAQEELGASPAPSLDDLLGRADVDAVIVATPNHLHCDHTVAAARAGKHVFCEKPMALSVSDCDRMIEACDRAGVKLMVGHSLRLTRAARRLREVVASGELGEPVFGLATYLFSGYTERPWGSWHTQRHCIGGLFFHMGIHLIDLFHAVFGPTQRVYCAGGRYGDQVQDLDDAAAILIEFASGATGVISCASISPLGERRLHIICRRGFASWDDPWQGLRFGADEAHLTTVEAAAIPGPDPLELELSSFTDWVLREAQPILTAAEGRAAVAVAEAADRARQTGRPAAVAAQSGRPGEPRAGA